MLVAVVPALVRSSWTSEQTPSEYVATGVAVAAATTLLRGRTPGRRALRLELVNRDGRPAGRRRVLARELASVGRGWLVRAAWPRLITSERDRRIAGTVLSVAALTRAARNPGRRSFGDRVARTRLRRI